MLSSAFNQESKMRRDRRLLARRKILSIFFTFLVVILAAPAAMSQTAPLPSWTDGPSRRAIIEFVTAVTTPSSADFVPEAERIATFDMDGTLWVEQPVYPEVVFAYDWLAARAAEDPNLAADKAFARILQGGRTGLPNLASSDLSALMNFAMSGMTVEAFNAAVQSWLGTARQECWNSPPTKLFYQPMLEVLGYLEANGFKNYIVTGSGQDFVRSFADDVLGMPPQQVLGTARLTQFKLDAAGVPQLVANPDVMLRVADAGKPEAIHLFIGQPPIAAFGNSGGDADMLAYASARKGRSLAMLVLHDDGAREYAYGPALGLPNTSVGVFDQALYDKALGSGWHVISMRNDWRTVLDGVGKGTGPQGPQACVLQHAN